ncbi:LADA_0D09868g1_1 [Lachancea dasiensis]|uniref:E3 ubiquitin-protein ligase n=1 Tax=Lachancea dasiensis TaxID=1072105 RepID=A0A1G4J7M5_9SACH|nr:LADA_0D09868g1_1 [Lachancea dasiensis]
MIRGETSKMQEHLKAVLQSLHDVPYFQSAKGPKERADVGKTLKSFIFRYLYYVISGHGRLLSLLFPGAPPEKFPKSLEEALSMDLAMQRKNDPFYTIEEVVTSQQHRHTGRNCGRKFLPGEPIYRCKECGYDETCVLCIHCFHPDDHKGHHVYTSICSLLNTGICDCGDVEAWHNSLHCRAELSDSDLEDQDFDHDEGFQSVEMHQLIENALTEILDHFLDVFNQNIEPLPTIQKEITIKLREMEQANKANEKLEFLKDLQYTNEYILEHHEDGRFHRETNDLYEKDGGLVETQTPDYAVMVYNDEYHNYSQAIAALKQGAPDDKHTDKLTACIDGEGRAMLKCSKDLPNILSGFFAIRTNGLSATLTTWVEYIHQEACKYMIAWIKHGLTIPNAEFQQIFRESLGTVLCSEITNFAEKRDVSTIVDKHFPIKIPTDTKFRYADLSVLDRGNTIPLSHEKELAADATDSISATLNNTITPTSKPYFNSRLQHFLFFDNRYWKGLRKEIQDVIISTMASSVKFKPVFCTQLVQIFNHMSRSLAFMDREPQLCALRECVVQLFTCPTNAKMIFESGSFSSIMWSVIDIFAEFSRKDAGLLIWQKVQKTNPSKSYRFSFKQGFYAVETILSKINDPNLLLRTPEFIAIVTLCKLFNGAWKIKRKEGEHVLREDQNFIPYVEYTTSVFSIIQTIDKTLASRRDEVEEQLILNAIRLLSTFLGHRTCHYKIVHETHEVIKFKVSKQRVAFMNPVHTLLSFLMEKVPLEKALLAAADCEDFLTISDIPLRSIVLCSQIDVGFWVRNGVSVLRQSSYYKRTPDMASYMRDIHLCQLTFLGEKDNLVRLIYNTLERWELLSWLDGEEEFLHTQYEDKIVFIIQQFIAFVYQILAERHSFKKFQSFKEKEYYQIKKSIMYGLFMEPLSYSDLFSAMPEYLTESSNLFDQALHEVSIFVEPKGLEDNGVFKLKPELYRKIDPLQLPNMGNDFEHSASVIMSHLAEPGHDAKKVVLEPQLTHPKHMDEGARNLGAFTRTDAFAKVIFNLLQVCLDFDEGTFIYGLLHLVHAIFKDHELANGKNSIPGPYLSIPVCNLFLTIIDSKSAVFSESAIAKADFLLEFMIRRRPEAVLDSLLSCFGEQTIELYKSKKLNQGVNLEESERDRKKRLAKSRQEKILSKFSKQQSKFMKGDEFKLESKDGDVDMIDVDVSNEEHDHTCALCQDSESTDAFVIPLYHEASPIFRGGNIHDIGQLATIWGGFGNDDDHPTVYDEETLDAYKKDGTRGSRKVFFSCNHYIHYKCFKRYAQKKRFSTNAFICPVCQTFSNCVMPVSRKACKESEISVTDLLESNVVCPPISYIHDSDVNEDFSGIFNMFVEINKQNKYYDRQWAATPKFQRPEVALVLAVHWSNTISMLEISTRPLFLGNDSVLQGREQKYKTLRNVLSSIAWLYKVVGPPSLEHIPYVNSEGVTWNHNQLFQYIIRNSLFTAAPISDTITKGLALFGRQLIVDFVKGQSPKHIEKMFEEYTSSGGSGKVDESLLNTMRSICDIGIADEALNTKLYTLAYASLEKNLLPTIRRCLIFLKVLNDTLNSEGSRLILNEVDFETPFTEYANLTEYINTVIKEVTFCDSVDGLLRYSCGTNMDDPYLSRIPYEYTGIVKLVDLAPQLNTYLTNSRDVKLRDEHPAHMKNAGNRLDFKICLTCGVKVHARKDHTELIRHLGSHCFKPFGLFLIPNLNEVCLILTNPRCSISIPAPYLNFHGEAGRNAIQRGDLTTLNLRRYEHLNNIWLNNEVPGLISRVMGDEFRVLIISNGVVLNFNRNVLRPRRANTDELDGDSSSSEGEDNDDSAGGEARWEIRPDEFFEEAGIRLEDADPIPGGDIRDFFQFINNLRTDTDTFEDGQAEGAGRLGNFFVPRFEFIPNFRNLNGPAEEAEGEGAEDAEDDEDAD